MAEAEAAAPNPNVLVVVTAGLPHRWPSEVDWPRRTRRRLLSNVGGAISTVEETAAALLWARPMGRRGPAAGDRDERHLGHLLPVHDRHAFVEVLPEAPRGWLEGGFDEVTRTDDAVGAATSWIEEHDETPWFAVVVASDQRGGSRQLVRLVGAAASDRTIIVIVDATGLAGEPPRARAFFDLTTPEPVGDTVAQFHPVFTSVHGLLPAILVEMLIDPPGPWRPGALPALPHDAIAVATALADAPPIDDTEYADQVHRLAWTEPTTDDVEPMSLVVATNDPDELEANLLRHGAVGPHQWLVVDNEGNRYENISALYDDAMADALHDLVLFLHQDVLLPRRWDARLTDALARLQELDPSWGVVGSAGVRSVKTKGPAAWAKRVSGHWTDPHGYRYTGPLPDRVESLDEMWLGVRRSSGIRFDRLLPGFHCYGIDLSLTARSMGHASYAIDAWMWHKAYDRNGRLLRGPDQSRKITGRETTDFAAVFARSYDYVADKWADAMPFNSTTALWGLEPGAPEAAPWPSTPGSDS